MRIGVDATCWANRRGYGRFTRELLPAMAQLAPGDEFLCFLDRSAASQFDLTAANIRPVVVELGRAPTEAAAADGYRSPFDMLRLTRAVWHARPDVFFSPSVYTYFPLPPGQRAVVTVHDAIAERFPELTLPSPRARLFWRLKVGLAIRQARLVLTVSEFAASELAQVLGIAPARIRVACEAPSPAFQPTHDAGLIRDVAARAGLPEGCRWFIYVGGFNPHKNVDVIVRAHAALARHLGDEAPHLVLVGTLSADVFHGDQAAIRRAIAESGTEALVHWAGFVPDEELRHLHSGALALVLASASEGFGLPAVEAAACGTPVIATIQSPLPQLLEGGGLFVAPADEVGLREAMLRLATDQVGRARMARAAREQAGKLGWPLGAHAALGALREAAA